MDSAIAMPDKGGMIPLFTTWPRLTEALPYLPIATLPTPVMVAEEAARDRGIGALYVKRDDLSAALYGGNKTRKLGFLLARAKQNAARSVMTFGGAGSNHALATALYAKTLGLHIVLVLGPQYNSEQVRANLLADAATGAELHYCAWRDTARRTAELFYHVWRRDGQPPFVIPAGGSSPTGMLGFVNAALELRAQVDAGMLPEPDLLYLPSGTMGSCVGLTLGLRLAGMNTRVVAVRVTTAPYTSLERAKQMYAAANDLLQRSDDAFPHCPWDDARFTIRDDYFGGEYALFTREGMAAVCYARDKMGIALEGVYTGKALAALLADADAGLLTQKHVLFWNTYAGGNKANSQGEYTHLPQALHPYFESPDDAWHRCENS